MLRPRAPPLPPRRPQHGSSNAVQLPHALPEHDFLLQGLEPLGWVKTQSAEMQHLNPIDVATQARIMAACVGPSPRPPLPSFG